MWRLTGWIVACLFLAGCTSTEVSPSATPSNSPTVVASTPAAPTTARPSSNPSATGSFDASGFVATIDNSWYPLKPGMTWTYRGTKDGEPAVDVVTVTDRTKVVDGVPCIVVQDRLTLGGRLAERTLDYFAQDSGGNVWYFGEDTAELDERGNVETREGTWHSGIDGATAGIFMEATPTVGKVIAQEHYAGHAEDQFKVIDLATTVNVPFGSFDAALVTEEWTPLEADVVDHKFYVRGIGEVREVSVKGPREELRLASFKAS